MGDRAAFPVLVLLSVLGRLAKRARLLLPLMDTNPKAQSITGGFEKYWQNVITN